jgi:hypothetical protein
LIFESVKQIKEGENNNLSKDSTHKKYYIGVLENINSQTSEAIS